MVKLYKYSLYQDYGNQWNLEDSAEVPHEEFWGFPKANVLDVDNITVTGEDHCKYFDPELWFE